MRAHRLGLVLVLLCGFVSVSAFAQPPGAVELRLDGEPRGSFVPRQQEYVDGGPSVTVFVGHDSSVTTASGEVVSGVECWGWQEDDHVRVMVALLIPKDNAENRFTANMGSLKRRLVGSHSVSLGENFKVEGLVELGIDFEIRGLATPQAR